MYYLSFFMYFIIFVFIIFYYIFDIYLFILVPFSFCFDSCYYFLIDFVSDSISISHFFPILFMILCLFDFRRYFSHSKVLCIILFWFLTTFICSFIIKWFSHCIHYILIFYNVILFLLLFSFNSFVFISIIFIYVCVRACKREKEI